MCYDYEFEYLARRAEEARKELKKAEQPQPAKPAEAPEEKPLPVPA